MMGTVIGIVTVAAFVCVVMAAARPDKTPLWVGVVLLCIIELLEQLPVK